MKSGGPILICPLDWGLGHATRMIPVIREFVHRRERVIICGHGASLSLLAHSFPECEAVSLPGYRVSYSSGNHQVWAMLGLIPSFLRTKRKEHQRLAELVLQYQPSMVISDNRYGLWHRGVKSVLVTHQLKVRLPGLWRFCEPLVQRVLRRWIERFDECWVPDHQGSRSLAGMLSQVTPLPCNVIYIGFLSRFSCMSAPKVKEDYVLGIVSGPEPHRSMLVKLMIAEFSKLSCRSIVICGEPDRQNELMQADGGVMVYSHLPDEKMEDLICRASVVVCRSGYSSLMDLVRLRKGALLIPTPGQPEQEYLASYVSGRMGMACCRQDELTAQRVLAYMASADATMRIEQ